MPGRWLTPMAGVIVPALATLLFRTRSREPWWVILAFTAVTMVAIWIVMLGREGVLALPWMRRTGINLEAIRGGGEPKIWLVAHIDSKWQPVSMIVRVFGVVGLAISICALVLAAAFRPSAGDVWLGVMWVASIPLMLSVVGARNHGTLDNASGVATVLHAVERLPHGQPVGVLITDAEELALAGARAWANSRTPVVALNCDSVDDTGELVLMYSGRAPAELVRAFRSASTAEGDPLRVMRLLPGVLTDHVPLHEAGWTTLTLSRGTLRTLGRVHTSSDTLAHMDGRGIAGAAKVLARAVMELS